MESVLNDSTNKVKLFICHQFHCYVQYKCFSYDKEMQRAKPETYRVLSMDYKMKLEPKKFRQKPSEWYRGKGMSWHVSVTTNKPFVCVDTVHRSQFTAGEDICFTKNLHLDHICRNERNQTAFAVASILGLLRSHIPHDLSKMRTILICTDSTSNYNNKLLHIIAPFVCKTYGIQLASISHS